jgi:predicted TIM-barrel fold metal-dependent hydrolase
MNGINLVDANCRIGPFSWGQISGDSVEAMLRRMDAVGIAQAVVSHTFSWHHDPATGNALVVAQVADQRRLRACWVAIPDTCAEVAPPKQFAADAIESSVAAIRAYPRDHGFDLDGPEFSGYLAECSEAGLPMLVDLAATNWRAIAAVADAHPDLTLIVCEIGYRVLRRAVAVLERHSNVLLDLSDLSTHEGLEWLCDRIGSGRVVFGTAGPLRDPGEAVARLLWSDLDTDSVQEIAAGTLQALLPEDTR